MKLTVKLMGMLKEHAPQNGELEIADGATIAAVLRELGIESETIQAFSVNGSIDRDRDRVLANGDELTVLPPVGGG